MHEKKRDFNQNLIEAPRSFGRLCNMINELEKDSSIEIAECNRMDLAVDVKYDVNLEPTMRKYSGQVSDKKFNLLKLIFNSEV